MVFLVVIYGCESWTIKEINLEYSLEGVVAEAEISVLWPPDEKI